MRWFAAGGRAPVSLLLLLLLVVVSWTQRGGDAVYLEATGAFGSRTAHLLSDSATANGRVVHAYTAPSNGDLYLVELLNLPLAHSSVPIVPRVENVVGRTVTSLEVLTGPRGCDNTDFTRAFETSNCARNSLDAIDNMAALLATWHVRKLSDACALAGGSVRTCVGPVRAVSDSSLQQDTALALIVADYIAVDAVSGYNGGIPSTVHVDMVLPKLIVTSTCANALYASGFSAAYANFMYDLISGALPDVWRSFERADGVLPQQRVVLLRTSPNSDDFRVALADSLGGTANSAYFRYYFISSAVFYSTNSSRDWGGLIPLDTALDMVNANQTDASHTCSLSLSVEGNAGNAKYVLRPPAPVSAVNYLYQPTYPRFYSTASCSFHIGELDENNLLVYPGCPDAVRCGGSAVYAIGAVPIYVPADVRYADYADDCDSAYPLSPKFTGFGLGGGDGPVYARYVPDEERCYAPYYSVPLILANNFVAERQRQCFNLGMRTAGLTQDVCQRPLGVSKCRKGWVYFSSYCYYKFAAETDTRFAVVESEAQQACDSIPWGTSTSTTASIVNVEVLVNADIDTRTWLQNSFVLWKRTVPGSPYRFRATTSTTSCDCLDFLPGISTSDTDLGDTTLCICSAAAFPVCRYHIKQYEVVDAYVSHSMRTIRTLRDGQAGTPWQGVAARCDCFEGWAGERCETRTCAIDLTFGAALASTANSTLTQFYLSCARNGACKNGNPNVCACLPRFGPSASLLPLSPLAPYAALACACPASSDPAGHFTINGVPYSGLALSLPCGGTGRGACTVDAAGTGSCACAAGLGGDACTCPIPVVPAGGYVLAAPNIRALPCNGRGKCCPSQECDWRSGSDRRSGSGSGSGSSIDGCACEDGLAGVACTCTTARDLALHVPVLTNAHSAGRATLDLGGVYAVSRMYISPTTTFTSPTSPLSVYAPVSGCTVLAVAGDGAACTSALSEGTRTWTCASGAQHIVLSTVEAVPLCFVRAFGGDGVCGSHPNPTSARFFNGTVDAALGYRGCTPTTCLCDADHTGYQCAAAISSVTVDDTGVWVRDVCGETTLPQRGVYVSPSAISKAGVGGCKCSAFTSEAVLPKAFFTGDACECVSTYVQSANAHLVCAGHGSCVAPAFPWGTCSADLDAREADPLSTPLVAVAGGCNDVITRILSSASSSASSTCDSAYTADGAFFGLFRNQIPALPFLNATTSSSRLSAAQLSFVASLMGNTRWFDAATGLPRASLVTPELLNRYAATLTAQSLATAIATGIWPHNAPLFDAYASSSSSSSSYATTTTTTSRAMDLTTAEDAEFVSAVYFSVLSPRRCNADVECATFGLGTCIYDAAGPWTPWRSGDASFAPALSVGDEGGCECDSALGTGFWSPALYCSACNPGYGPSTLEGWIPTVQAQRALVALYDAASTAPADRALLYDPARASLLLLSSLCSVPFTDSVLCGGFGTVQVQQGAPVDVALEVFTTPEGAVLTPRCTAIRLNGAKALLLQGRFLDADLYVYSSSSSSVVVVSIIDGTAYVNGAAVRVESDSGNALFSLRIDSASVSVSCVHEALYASPARVELSSAVRLVRWSDWTMRVVTAAARTP